VLVADVVEDDGVAVEKDLKTKAMMRRKGRLSAPCGGVGINRKHDEV